MKFHRKDHAVGRMIGNNGCRTPLHYLIEELESWLKIGFESWHEKPEILGTPDLWSSLDKAMSFECSHRQKLQTNSDQI